MNSNKTALITGASSGIGLELARTFAKNNTDVLLVARSKNKLQDISTALSQEHGVKVHILAKDLSAMGAGSEVYEWCKTNNVTINYLINNAGFGDFGMFAESNWEKQLQMINLNITALTHLCRLFIPDMISRKEGRIMNVASTAAFQPGPTMAVYFATKAYVLHFSEAIGNELTGTGVTVTALCPGATESGFQAAADMEDSKLVNGKKLPTSAEVAQYGYNSMMQGKAVAIHGTLNYIMANSVRFSPRSAVVKLARWLQE